MALVGLGRLLLLLVLLGHAHSDLRARDPGEEEEGEGEGPEGGPGARPRTAEHPQQGDPGGVPARAGNWCPFVHKRVVSTPVRTGTESFNMEHISRCPSGTPDCRLRLSKPATRTVYTQGQRVVTSILWHCCRGYRGENCEEAETESSTLTGGPGPGLEPGPEPGHGRGRAKLRPTGVPPLIGRQYADPNREQNDHHGPHRLDDPAHQHQQHNTTNSHAHNQGHAHQPYDTPQHGVNPYSPSHPHHQPGADHAAAVPYPNPAYPDPPSARPYPNPAYPDPPSARPNPDSTYLDPPAALPLPHMMALILSQLQPLLQTFNHSLDHLTRQVDDLARDVAQLKTARLEAEPREEGLREPRAELEQEEEEEQWEARLEQVEQNIRDVRTQLHTHRAHVEERLHSQHAMLHYNLTSFKTDVDMKLKRHQKMLQVNLQAMNSTLTELKLDQDQDQDQVPVAPPERPRLPPPVMQSSDTSALWDALERLDNTVVNNTVKVMSLMEDMEVTSGSVQRLQRDLKDQERRVNQTARTSQVQFMETGLEVEAAKVAVLSRVAELAGNLSLQGQRLQENVEDVDYLYTAIYRQNNATVDCDCSGLAAAVAQLEKNVANVTSLANDNRLALEEDPEVEEGQWGGASDWEPAVEAVQQKLQEVRESVASKSRTMEDELAQLSQSVQVLTGISDGQQDQIKRLMASFNSLLKDAIRHSDVLELLLGEEVLEFLEWPVQDQEAHSIPVLKELLRQQQEQLSGLELNLTSLLRPNPDVEEVPSADQPSSSSSSEDWTPGEVSRSSGGEGPARERQVLLPPEHRPVAFRADGSFLWNLEKMVEDLQRRVVQLEQRRLNSSSSSSSEGEAKLRAEVTWLKRGLEEHLRVFKNVFSNADVLVSSEETLELDKLFELVKSKDGRRQKKRGGGEGGGGGKHRSRRQVSGVVPVPFDQSQQALMFMGGAPHVDANGVIVFKGPLTQDQFHSGSFTIPVGGVYLFVLTLDMRPGHAHVVLRRSGGDAPVSLLLKEVTEAGPVTGMGVVLLRAGEEVRLELRSGQGAESGDNVFVGLLLQRDT